jgi:hypothetical protein
MNKTSTNKAFAELMAPYSPELRTLALATRAFLFETIPGAMEQVDAKSKVVGYGFGTNYTDMICSIMPNKSGITLGIGWATELPDAQHLLEGDRQGTQAREAEDQAGLGDSRLESSSQSGAGPPREARASHRNLTEGHDSFSIPRLFF